MSVRFLCQNVLRRATYDSESQLVSVSFGDVSSRGDDRVVLVDQSPLDVDRRRSTPHFVDSGSPHHVQCVSTLPARELATREGRRIRQAYSQGANVNFLVVDDDSCRLRVRTYERGVEDLTLACGTGVVACAVVCAAHSHRDAIEPTGADRVFGFVFESIVCLYRDRLSVCIYWK